MDRKLLIAGTILGIVAIILGAFAAHGLQNKISPQAMHAFETGVKYQMYHAFFLLIVGANKAITKNSKQIILLLVLFGVVFFSGSIYGLATTAITSINFKAIAFITPIGGLLLIAAWVVLLVNFLKLKSA